MFRRTMQVPNIPVFDVFDGTQLAAACLQDIAKGVLDPRLPWADTFAVRFRQPVDLVHALKTVKGLLLLVHHGLHGAVGMIFLYRYTLCCYL